MELLDGSDLHELAPLPVQQACLYLHALAQCLADAPMAHTPSMASAAR